MTYTFSKTFNGSGLTKSFTDSPAFDGGKPLQVSVPSGSTVQVNIAMTRANLKGVALYSSVILTVKTNSSGSPTDTIPLAAGEVITWSINEGRALNSCPFTANVTALYLVNSGSDAADFIMLAAEDVTP